MSHQSSVTDRRPPSVLIWSQLDSKEQGQVIQLMAHLAFRLVMAQPNSFRQEVNDAIVTQHPQNPS